MASANLLSPPSNISPATALALSQKAPPIIASPPTSNLPFPLSLLLNSETPSTWTIHENAFQAALRTGDDASARKILDRLTQRFGSDNERVIVLNGIYSESQARTPQEFEAVFKEYETILRDDPTNFAVRKRRVAVLKALGREADAITALTVLLENSPTDAEAWAELADLYAGQGAWGQAIYALEEVLLIVPNSWSAHAHLATLHYLSALPATAQSISALTLALKHFSRALELNGSYLRGFYGLKLVSKTLIPLLSDSSPSSNNNHNSKDDIPPPKLATVKKLEELATSKLGDIVRNYSAGKKRWQGYDEAEVAAARELLDREGTTEK